MLLRARSSGANPALIGVDLVDPARRGIRRPMS
jgi:hypothetical protein